MKSLYGFKGKNKLKEMEMLKDTKDNSRKRSAEDGGAEFRFKFERRGEATARTVFENSLMNTNVITKYKLC